MQCKVIDHCDMYLYLPCHQRLGSLELLHKLHCIQYSQLLLKGALDDGGEHVREALVWDVAKETLQSHTSWGGRGEEGEEMRER